MINKELNEKINVALTCVLSFLIPVLPIVLPLCITLIVINWLIRPRNLADLKLLFKIKLILPMIVLYIAYVTSLFYSDNLKEGLSILETKLSLLLFPLVFVSFLKVNKEKINLYLTLFIGGVIAYVLIAFIHAFYCFFKPVYTDLYGVLYDLGYNYFFYSYLSYIFHPSFTAMYTVFALFLIVYFQDKGIFKNNYKWFFVMLLLCLYVLLLSSRAGWITLFGWCFIFIYINARKMQYVKPVILLMFVVFGFLFFNVYKTPSMSQRMPSVNKINTAILEKDENNKKVSSSDESSARRIFVWKASLEVFKQNFLIGTGVGDTKDILLDKYIQKGMIAEHKAQLNSHNQYLSTSVTLGIVGLVLLVLMILLPLLYILKNKDFLLLIFLFLLSFNFIFESMLEVQAGVIFYSFFITLLSYNTTHFNNSIK